MRFILIYIFVLVLSCISRAQSIDEVSRIINPGTNFYQALGISNDASPEQIQKAYRALLSRFHPDRHQQNPAKLGEANQVMARLNEIRETLIDPLKRKSYDLSLNIYTYTANNAKPQGPAWEKWRYPDFSTPQEPKTEAPKPDVNEPQNSAQTEKSSSENQTQTQQEASREKRQDLVSQDSSTPPPSDKAERQNAPQAETGTAGKKAQQVYGETSRCGVGYYQTFIDIMI